MSNKYGFVYLWYDRKHKRFYVGCHWGSIEDGYVCSSPWMRQAYKIRPEDFKRRILKTGYTNRDELYVEEFRWLQMIKPSEIKPTNPNPKYYNLNIVNNNHWTKNSEQLKTVGEKISLKKTGIKPNNSPEMLIERGKKISAKKKGVKHTAEHRAKLSESRKGSTRSEEAKAKTSASLKQAYADGKHSKRPKKPRKVGTTAAERWADPIWAENMRARLREGSAKRKDRAI